MHGYSPKSNIDFPFLHEIIQRFQRELINYKLQILRKMLFNINTHLIIFFFFLNSGTFSSMPSISSNIKDNWQWNPIHYSNLDVIHMPLKWQRSSKSLRIDVQTKKRKRDKDTWKFHLNYIIFKLGNRNCDFYDERPHLNKGLSAAFSVFISTIIL